MNAQIVVAQAGSSSAAGSSGAAPRVIKIAKPEGNQSVTLELGFDQSVKLDLSGVANEKITLVHVGEKLIILFDNQSTVTVHPFFDSMGVPLQSITVEASPGRDLPSSEFASTFPISNDQSILPAAGDGAGTPASGANFTSVGVDPLAVPNPLPLLPPEELPPIIFTQSPPVLTQGTTPTVTPTITVITPPSISAGTGPALSVDESFLTTATNGISGSTPLLANTHTA